MGRPNRVWESNSWLRWYLYRLGLGAKIFAFWLTNLAMQHGPCLSLFFWNSNSWCESYPFFGNITLATNSFQSQAQQDWRTEKSTVIQQSIRLGDSMINGLGQWGPGWFFLAPLFRTILCNWCWSWSSIPTCPLGYPNEEVETTNQVPGSYDHIFAKRFAMEGAYIYMNHQWSSNC